MVVCCPNCREMVHLSAGFIVSHGARHHGVMDVCAASGTAYVYIEDCCGI